MPGSSSNPVQLDHYQTIKEVGWPVERFVAFTFDVQRDNEFEYITLIACPLEDSVDAPSDGNDFVTSYLTTTRIHYPTSGSAWSDFRVFRNGSWVSTTETPTLSGLPTSVDETTTFDAETFPCEVFIGPPAASYWPRGQWNDASGATITYTRNGTENPLPVPGQAATFKTAASATFSVMGANFLESKRCYVFNRGTMTQTTAYGYFITDKHTVSMASKVFTLSGVSLVYKGKTFHATGYYWSRPDGGIHDEPTTAGSLWIVCERVD